MTSCPFLDAACREHRPALTALFRPDLFWPGCLLASIAHAVFAVRAPFLAHEHSWDGKNYSVQDTQGSHGTVAFGDDRSHFVAVMYSLENDRYRSNVGPDLAEAGMQTLLANIPDGLKGLRDEALRYIMQDVQGVPMPVLTSAFWSDLETPLVTACEPWRDVVKQGAEIFQKQFSAPSVALALWASDCDFDEKEVALVQALFARRLAATGVVRLSYDEIRLMYQRSSNEGLQAPKILE
jgi:hypothetical protein